MAFCWVCLFGSRNWVRLLYNNICKPCNQSMALKQEKCNSNSCLCCIWEGHCRCVSYYAAQKVPTLWAVISLLKRNRLFTFCECRQVNENGFCTSSWRQAESQPVKNCPGSLKVVSFQNLKHSSYLAFCSWRDMLICLQLQRRVELSTAVMQTADISVI